MLVIEEKLTYHDTVHFNFVFTVIQKKPRLKKVKLLDSDDDEEDQGAGNSAATDREAIANELFEGAEDSAEVI